MPFRMKRAVRASRNLCEYQTIYTNERRLSLLHLTLIEIFQISILSNERRQTLFNMFVTILANSLAFLDGQLCKVNQ